MIKLAVTLFAFLVVGASARAVDPADDYITYEAFLHAVEDGQIKEVRFYDISTIQGEMSGPTGVTRFDAAFPIKPASDPLLMRLLREKSVKIGSPLERKFPGPRFGMGYWQLMPLVLLMVVMLLVVSLLQLRILRRLERKG